MIWDDEGYIFVKEIKYVRKKIPKGHVKCPVCDGSGEVRLYYGQPWDRGQFTTCWCCYGKGFISKEWLEELKKMGSPLLNDRILQKIRELEEKRQK